MNIRDLELLIALAKDSNLSHVALEQGTSQPRLSERLRRLESAVGSRLFDRNSRGVQLTSAGELFLPFAQTIVNTYASGIEVVTNLHGEVRGQLHLGISHTHPAVIPHMLLAFYRLYPAVNVTITRIQASQMVSGLVSKRFDLCLCYEPPTYEGLVWEPTFEAFMVVVAANDIDLPEVASLQNLVDFSCVLPTTACSTRLRLNQSLDQQALTLKVIMEIDDPQALLAVVKTGSAIAILPETKVPSTRKLKTSRIVDPKIHVKGGMMRRTEASVTTRALANFLKAQMKSVGVGSLVLENQGG